MGNNPNPFGPWQPWSVHQIAALFSTLTVPWWIAGGWALDLFLGVQIREHEDIDVQILRRDHLTIRGLLDAWDVQAASPTTHPDAWPFRAWEAGTVLSSVVHDVWCRPSQADPWALQLMLAETDGDCWQFRRDARITRPLSTVGRRTKNGIPYLVPELQLLYKAKEPRPKDEADFARTVPFLDPESRRWLIQALALSHPDHHWLGWLEGSSSRTASDGNLSPWGKKTLLLPSVSSVPLPGTQDHPTDGRGVKNSSHGA